MDSEVWTQVVTLHPILKSFELELIGNWEFFFILFKFVFLCDRNISPLPPKEKRGNYFDVLGKYFLLYVRELQILILIIIIIITRSRMDLKFSVLSLVLDDDKRYTNSWYIDSFMYVSLVLYEL